MTKLKLILVTAVTLGVAGSVSACAHKAEFSTAPAAPPPPPPPPPAEPVAATPPPVVPIIVKRATVVGNRVHIPGELEFDVDKATLKADAPETKDILTALHDFMQQNPHVTQLRVEGHTDDTGKSEHNMKLSQERADAVVAWEVAAGIDKSRFLAKGLGSSKPFVANDSEEHRHQNRRTEFHIALIDGKAPPAATVAAK